MARRALVTALALAAAALLTGPARADSSVAIKNVSFQPSSVTIHPGETVTWTNMDSAPHTVTSDTPGAFDSSPSCNPGTGLGCLNNGNTFSHSFAQAGSFPYHCKVHSSMHGTITVSAPAPPPTQPAPGPTAAPTTRAPAATAAPTTAAPAITTTTAAVTTTVAPAAAEQATTSSTSSAAAGGQALATRKTGSGDSTGALGAVAAVLLAVVAGGGLFYRRRLG
jgi:plastocyanin